VLVPTGTPQPIIAQISGVTADIIKQPDFDLALQAAGLEARADASPAAAEAFLAAERQRLIPIIEAAGLQRQ
jgi:tripartite-type tricarboxylate transporter receptor subunit TctC